MGLAPIGAESVLECRGKVVLPALIDMAYPKTKSFQVKSTIPNAKGSARWSRQHTATPRDYT